MIKKEEPEDLKNLQILLIDLNQDFHQNLDSEMILLPVKQEEVLIRLIKKILQKILVLIKTEEILFNQKMISSQGLNHQTDLAEKAFQKKVAISQEKEILRTNLDLIKKEIVLFNQKMISNQDLNRQINLAEKAFQKKVVISQ